MERFPVGAYLLDALEPQERRRFQQHLARCGRCRRDYDALRGLPALLARLPAQQAVALHAGLEPGSATPPSRRRRPAPRRIPRWVAGAAIAGALAGVGAVAVTRQVTPHSAGSAVVALVPAPDRGLGLAAASGTVMVFRRDGGSRLQLRIEGLPAGISCSVVVLRTDGSRQTLGGWIADYTGQGKVAFDSPNPPGALRAVLVETAGRRLLLQGHLGG
jgi:anti-sigma factor RsiW